MPLPLSEKVKRIRPEAVFGSLDREARMTTRPWSPSASRLFNSKLESTCLISP